MQEEKDILEEEQILVSEEEKGKRLDVFLTEIYTSHSRSYLKKIIDDGFVLVNNKKQKCGYKLNVNDSIDISFPQVQEFKLIAEDLPLDIIYQDKDIAIINKPKGMVVHPAVGNPNKTLVNAIMYHIKDLSGINGELRPGIVHRIDNDTTGLLDVAKNDFAHRELSEQIKTKTCKREYLALVHGAPHNKQGIITTYIGRSLKDRKKMAIVREGEGRIAITEYDLVEKYGQYSLMHFSLKTGRTHQIRVHCTHLNTPIVGDQIYGVNKNNLGVTSQLLHAFRLTLIHPRDKKEMTFEIDLPKEFQNIISNLKRKMC